MVDLLKVAVIGCGRLGQHYAHIYNSLPDTELVAIAEHNPERRQIVGSRFGIQALYPDAKALFDAVKPDVAAIVLPGKYIKDAVMAAVDIGVRGVTTDKPITAVLADADEMVDACAARGIVFGGGNLQRAMGEVYEAGLWLKQGEFGGVLGGSVHGWGGEISGGGCQHVSVLRLFLNAEVKEVMAWAKPREILDSGNDSGLIINARFTMTNGLEVSVFGEPTPHSGVEVWTADTLVRWDWNPPEIFRGTDESGKRVRLKHSYTPYEYPEFYYLGTSIRSFLNAVRTGSDLWISGHDLRQALEVAIAARDSALYGNMPIYLPLADRSRALYPSPYRWEGGDATGRAQSKEEAGEIWCGY